jgi:hypothetical protein
LTSHPQPRENAIRFPGANGGVCFAIAALEPRALGYTIRPSGCRIGDFRMLKNRTIAIAILSALLALSQVAAAPAATPLATIRVAAKPTNPLNMGHPPGDFDRAFIAQQTGGTLIQELQAGAPRNFECRKRQEHLSDPRDLTACAEPQR